MNANNRTVRTPRHQTLNSFAAGTIIFAIARGIPPDKINNVTGISPTAFTDPGARIPEDVVPKVWRLLIEAFPGEVLSLEMAKAAPISILGVMSQGLGFAPTLRSGLELLKRNCQVLSDRFEVMLSDGPDGVEVATHHPMDALDGGAAIEVGFAVGQRILWEMAGRNRSAERIEFSHKPFGPVEVYEEYFKTEVRFEQARNKVVLCNEIVDQEVEQSDELLFKYVQQHLDHARGQLAESEVPTELRPVYDAVARKAATADYSVASVARSLNMSPRSLQQLANRHGFRIGTLIEEARATNARQLLCDPSLSTEMVSHVLGYSDDRAFRRAFKRWSGMTPAEFRRSGLEHSVIG